MNITFKPTVRRVSQVVTANAADAIKLEPMLYGASWRWAFENGGALTKKVMLNIKEQVADLIPEHAIMGYHPIIDTKSVLLMQGQYPCIPGWHCDGVPRPHRGAQPDVSLIDEPVYHFVCVIDQNDSPATEFLTDTKLICVDKRQVWSSVNRQVPDDADIYRAASGEIVQFQRGQLHRGNQAQQQGWRYFFRLSFYHMPVMNEIRNQVQVYVDTGTGW